MNDKDTHKNQGLALDEWHYRQDVLNALFKLTIGITLAMAVAYLLVYAQTPALATLILAVTFPLLPLMVWWCWHLLHRAKMQLALQLYIAIGTVYTTLVILFMPSNYLLIGMMGIFILVRISTFLDNSKSIVLFGALWASLYLIAITLRHVLNIPQPESGSWTVLFWNIVPVSILVIFVLLDRTVTRYLAEALARSETARQNLVESYGQLEQQKEALEKSEAKLSNLAARLEQTNLGLQVANEELKSFAYVVSHDIRAPLRAMHNYADFLQEDLAGSLEEEPQSYLKGLTQAVNEAEKLVEDLLEFARVGRQPIRLEAVDMERFLKTLVATLDLPADVEIVWAEKWPVLRSEPILLRQIFQNLILNGVKFNHTSPRCLELGWQADEQENYEFLVRDNGIGIAAHHQEQIFQVFQRLHTRQEYEGTGIGLAIVKKAVDKLGGSVRVESATDAGSTFIVTLPNS